MKAAVINTYGKNDVVEIKDMPQPKPGPEEVLIRVRAAGVNPVDWKIRDGMLRSMVEVTFPRILGRECAGEVVETGSAVRRFKNGDRVIALPELRANGTFAEYVCAPEQTVYFKPGNISFEEAASIPIAGLAALRSLRDAGRISAGKNILIIGAAGGVGHFAVQIARVYHARVTAVCSEASADFVKSLHADKVVDYAREDVTKGGERYHIIFDAVAARSFEECKNILTPQGVYIRTLPLSGRTEEGEKRALPVPGGPTAEDMAWMRNQIERGRIRVAVEKVYSLDQAKEALAYSETGKARGKIALTMA